MKRKNVSLFVISLFLFTLTSVCKGQTLAEALDNTEYVWTSGSSVENGAWTGQTAVAYFGGDAAVSGGSGSSWLMTEVTLPIKVEFTTRFSNLLINGDFGVAPNNNPHSPEWQTFATMRQSTDWNTQSVYIPGSGKRYIRWLAYTFSDNTNNFMYVDEVKITALPIISLAEALDVPQGTNIETSAEGSSPYAWIGQNEETYDGMDAVVTPRNGEQNSWIQTVVNGPAEVSFFWKAENYYYGNALNFGVSMEGKAYEARLAIATKSEWEQVRFVIPPGEHTLRWFKDNSSSDQPEIPTGYLDKLSITPISNEVGLNEAVDNMGLNFTNLSANWPWFGIGKEDAVGGDAIMSPLLSEAFRPEDSFIETMISGPAKVSYKWKLEPTNPSNISLPSRMRIVCELMPDTVNDTVKWTTVASMSLSGKEADTEWREVSFEIPQGEWKIRWSGNSYGFYEVNRANYIVIAYLDDIQVSQITRLSLNEALDTNELIFSTNRDQLGWYGVEDIDGNGTDVAKSAIGEASWLRTRVSGPGILNYRWKKDGVPEYSVRLGWEDFPEPKFGYGHDQGLETGWKTDSIYVPKGDYIVEWKSIGVGTGSLDQVSFTPQSYLTLGEALDAPHLTWETGSAQSNVDWFGREAIDAETASVAMAPFVPNGENAWFKTRVRGPGKIQFKWKLPPYESNSMGLYRSTLGDNTAQLLRERRSGVSYNQVEYQANTWYAETLIIGEGLQTLIWDFRRDISGGTPWSHSYVEPHAYVDEVRYEYTGLWAQSIPFSDGVSYNDWLGFFVIADDGWVYHFHHGWEWVYAEDTNHIWMYDLEMEWLWTTHEHYPFVYSWNLKRFLWYLKDSTAPRQFYDFEIDGWLEY